MAYYEICSTYMEGGWKADFDSEFNMFITKGDQYIAFDYNGEETSNGKKQFETLLITSRFLFQALSRARCTT